MQDATHIQKQSDREAIKKQAQQIRDIVQRIIDACDADKTIDPYARAKVTSGSIAQDAAVLGIQIARYLDTYKTEA